MPRFKGKIQNNKNISYILSKQYSFTKNIISEVNLGGKETESVASRKNIEEGEKKKPKKIYCVGLLKFKNQ